jgi:spore germination protein GerM
VAKRRQAQLIFFLAALFILLVAVAGCDRAASLKSGDATDSPSTNSSNAGQNAAPKQGGPAGSGVATETIDIVLYFSDDQGEKLVKELRSVTKTDEVAKAAVVELIEGPSQAGVATIPSGTTLLGVSIARGVAEVDLSKEFVDNHQGGSAGEKMTVYSIVNTLTEFSTVKEVRFLVEGEALDTIAGHMDVSRPVKREESLL